MEQRNLEAYREGAENADRPRVMLEVTNGALYNPAHDSLETTHVHAFQTNVSDDNGVSNPFAFCGISSTYRDEAGEVHEQEEVTFYASTEALRRIGLEFIELAGRIEKHHEEES